MSLALAAYSTQAAQELGARLHLWTLLPFAALLIAIAVLPLVAHHWWERNRNRALVALICALPVAYHLLADHGSEGAHQLLEKVEEYASFIALLGALFVITGGIYVRGSLSGTPLVNTVIMACGAMLANLIGTTGASVLLIRPLLRANAPRRQRTHIVVFFIFVVSNCGGLLTPLGDPPLFLGFIKGVPFEWTLRFWREWLFVNSALLVVFNVWDQRVIAREARERSGDVLEAVQQHGKLGISGARNLLFLGGVVATILAAGYGFFNGGLTWAFGVQEGVMIALTVLAYSTTPRELRERNRFTFAPIVEVAVLFAGIFVTMAPALLILNSWSQGQREIGGLEFALHEPWHYFWATGLLSSFLDNAPTYLAFGATAAGAQGIPAEGRYLALLAGQAPQLLAAISCGAVLMGANSYIGNGPNFMVKAIAEENGVKMPSFFAYMLYAALILLPIFAIATWLFHG